ncbi:MAG: FkbM family methyltransferase [Rhodospirillales bacterium]|nr:FkbM family methyltransferase [Rhodospirillales bacterium]MBT5350976.1 FkbM family methyltransferase [Rhodospirillales bacterium]MBT6111361.1 FkbM family methyltransferase [Rhodospirillales bacterium]MBT7506032.1 FkbM family methyltransferase [Rhodospirillales bacterium]MBT7777164.1 FkbM family methyltransferase [Rhodospirillales bacterium]
MTDENRLRLIHIKGEVSLWLPDDLTDLATYVFLEQEDWFEPEVDFLRRFLQSGMRVIDIGAAFGAFSLPMAKAVGQSGRVWSYEPTSGTATALKRSSDENGFDWQEVIQAAVSNTEGVATLNLYDSAEFNCLSAHGDEFSDVPLGSEAVPVCTLAMEDTRQEFGPIDFVKIDAEGEEYNILEGGRELFLNPNGSRPVVLIEISNGENRDWGLANKIERMGYELYQLAPGPNVLVPASEQTDDLFLLNLFLCPPERVEELEKRGLLVRDFPIATTSTGQWSTYSSDSQWYQLQDSANHNFTKFPKDEDEVRYLAALEYYSAYANTPSNFSLPERMSALRESARILIDLYRRSPTLPRCLSLGRVCAEFGQRRWARKALKQAVDSLTDVKNAVVINEPFLPPSARIANMAPDTQNIAPEECYLAVVQHAGAAAIESYEMNMHFSSFYTNDTTLPLLRLLQSLPYRSAAIERRIQLKMILTGELESPIPSSVFADSTELNLNPEIWYSA